MNRFAVPLAADGKISEKILTFDHDFGADEDEPFCCSFVAGDKVGGQTLLVTYFFFFFNQKKAVNPGTNFRFLS